MKTLRIFVVRKWEIGFEAGPPLPLADLSRHKRSLGLLERCLQVAALRLAILVEYGAGSSVLVLGPRLLLEAARYRHVLGGLHQPVEVLRCEVEVHEGLDGLVMLQRVGAHVYEQRAREQILAGANGIFGGLDAVDGESPERAQVVLVVRVAEVSQCVRVARDALHEHVVVLAHLDVGLAADLLLVTHDDLVEEFVGARLRAGTIEVQWFIRPTRAHLAPARDLVLCGRFPNGLELLARDVLGPIVALLVHDDRDAVISNRDLDELDPVLLAHGYLLGRVYRPGSVRDLGVTLAEGLEAVAGSRAAYLDARVGVLFPEKLSRSLGDRVNGAGTFDGHIARDSLATTAPLITTGTTAGREIQRESQDKTQT